MRPFCKRKPGAVTSRYPVQQVKFSRAPARFHAAKAGRQRLYRDTALPSPEVYYAQVIEGFHDGGSGWAHGCCPFHDDHNPSFAMNLETGGYKCLSSTCGVSGGNIVTFVCELNGLSRKEAYRFLEGWK